MKYAIYSQTRNLRTGSPTITTAHIKYVYNSKKEAVSELRFMKDRDMKIYGKYTEDYDDWFVDKATEDKKSRIGW